MDSNDNSYIIGRFAGHIDFDPGDGVAEATVDEWTRFILKINSEGLFEWVYNWSDNYPWVTSISTEDNEFYIGGTYKGSVDLDPGENTDIYISNNPTSSAFFISKYSVE